MANLKNFAKESRILVVDDMRVMRRIVRNYLHSIGYTNTVDASNGEEAWWAIEDFHREKKDFDLVIADWNMPHADGFEFLKRIREDQRFAQLPVIFVTAESDASHVDAAVNMGVDAYITKPFEVEELEKKMEKVFAIYESRRSS